ncbi:MAG: hypothetical protein GY816_22095 [Cytophagales bacterium]|nr:hypothetical protein [Cytophagales bacterium]
MERQDIEKSIQAIINTNHQLGEQVGGSGHKATIYADILDLNTEELADSILKVSFKYAISRESEFTVYTEDDDLGDVYVQAFSIKNQKVIHIEPPVQVQSSMNPKDFITPDLDDDWFDKLDAAYDKGYSEQDNQAAIDYFQSKDEFPKKLLTPTESYNLKLFPKSMWENNLKVLVKWIEREDVKEYFCKLIDDPNWPGFSFAWNTLKSSISSSIPMIEKFIKSGQDSDHVTILEELKEETIQYEKHVRQVIFQTLGEIYHKQHPESKETRFTIIQLTPVYKEGIIIYEVQFKIISKNQNQLLIETWSFAIENDMAVLQ